MLSGASRSQVLILLHQSSINKLFFLFGYSNKDKTKLTYKFEAQVIALPCMFLKRSRLIVMLREKNCENAITFFFERTF